LPWAPARLKASKPKGWTDDPVTLGGHLKKTRRERGLLQREVASKLGVALDTYRFWETDRTRPRAASWARIIGWLGYDPAPELETIGERLRAKRRALGWTEAEVAAHFGWDDATVRRYELRWLQVFLAKD
jgi:transcriptional regulator with XRE-family HTH domain